MSKESVAMWRQALAKAVEDPAFKKQMESLGSVIKMMGPEESEAFIKGQYESFRAIVDKLGIRIKG
jgi:tripartite-type tricarboxylate transporter receptor subunit TctC